MIYNYIFLQSYDTVLVFMYLSGLMNKMEKTLVLEHSEPIQQAAEIMEKEEEDENNELIEDMVSLL